MQIIIPMSGFGERFRQAGYRTPKPLIEIDDKPIIQYVIELFPGETDLIFICNEEHLQDEALQMESLLRRYCPTGRVLAIAPHRLGPVHAVLQCGSQLDLDQPTIVNYCDFTCYWDWAHFKQTLEATQCVGALAAYRGFHPHSLGTTKYAYLREKDFWLLNVQEKMPFTSQRMEEFASSGTYYFASGRIMLEAFRTMQAQDLRVNGEYYVSLAYRPLLAQGARVLVYPIEHFMQWGTPEDVQEYREWSQIFRTLTLPPGSSPSIPRLPRGTRVIPMAGQGERFWREGYTVPKPLIPVFGKPMVVQACEDLPPAQKTAFVLRQDLPEYQRACAQLVHYFPEAIIHTLPELSQGQALSALAGLEAVIASDGRASEPITFAACDQGLLYEQDRYDELIHDPEVDVVVWCVRGYPTAIRNPLMFGWIQETRGKIGRVSVKVPLLSPPTDPIVLGIFTFKRAQDFHRCLEALIKRDGRVNGEFYLDSCINDAISLGLKCSTFEVNHLLSWGTPDDLRTFEYWQSCFHKWAGHPYRLEQDPRISGETLSALALRFAPKLPNLAPA